MKISCDVIEDLLPLYIDQIASEESVRLVEEHLAECESCRSLLKKMEEEKEIRGSFYECNAVPITGKSPDISEETRILRKIRRRINRKRALAVLSAIICVTLVYMTAHYLYYDKTSYLSWEDSGLSVKDNKLYASKTTDGRLWSVIAPNQKEQFYYICETAWIRKNYPVQSVNEVVSDFEAQYNMTQADLETEDSGIPGLEKVYYVPPEAVKDAMSLWDFDEEAEGEKRTAELREQCILIWDANDMEKTSTEQTGQEEAVEDTEGDTEDIGNGENSAKLEEPQKLKTPRTKEELEEALGTVDEQGEWTPPEGSYIDPQTGNIMNKDGVMIGTTQEPYSKARPGSQG